MASAEGTEMPNPSRPSRRAPSRSKSAAATRASRCSKRWDRLRARLDLISQQRGADMADLPRRRQRAAVPGLHGEGSRPAGDPHRPRRGLAGRRTPRPRAPGRRGTGPVEDAPRGAQSLAASPTAITLLTNQELDWLEKRAGDGEIGRGGRIGRSNVPSLNRLRAMVSLPKYSRKCRGLRPATADRWRDRVLTSQPFSRSRRVYRSQSFNSGSGPYQE